MVQPHNEKHADKMRNINETNFHALAEEAITLKEFGWIE